MSPPQIPNRGTTDRSRGFTKWLKSPIASFRNRSASPEARPSHPRAVESGVQIADLGPDSSTIGRFLATSSEANAGSTIVIPVQPQENKPSNPQGNLSRDERPSASHGSSVREAPPLGTPSQPRQSRLDRAKDRAGLAGSFIQLLLMKAPDVASMDPVTVVFGIAKVVLELSQGMQDNMDAVDLRIASTLSLLYAIEGSVKNWKDGGRDEALPMKSFRATLQEELTKLMNIKNQSKGRQFALQEEDKQRIVDIFDRVNAARERLALVIELEMHMATVEIGQDMASMLNERLDPSRIADYYYYPVGEQAKAIRRGLCTPGTRSRIQADIESWANDLSNTHSVYWLLGPAGTGKTTIACTITNRFKRESVAEDNIVLGANFFCSRLFQETRSVSCILPTIVYQLSIKCKAFADALHKHGDFSKVYQRPADQLQALLVTPWEQSRTSRIANKDPVYLVDIDAVDELEGDGGPEFTGALLDVQGQLQGLKFFITSREDRALVARAESLGDGKVCRLREVSLKEADHDLKTYLMEQLGRVASDAQADRLVTDADGLFIYAATVVEHVVVKNRSVHEQRLQLNKLLKASTFRGATTTLDNLYLQILNEALNDPDQDIFENRLRILHTFLCTVERTSSFVVTHLLDGPSNDNDDAVSTVSSATEEMLDDSSADGVVERLHAVLYRQGDQVMWFHKSFPDFVFNQTCSQKFYCDQSFHQHLAEGSLRIMHRQLHFNIADITNSFLFDQNNTLLQTSVERKISPALRYACRNWSRHCMGALIVDSVNILQQLREFLQLRVLFWIEAMNLLGQRGHCSGMLLEAQEWLVSCKDVAGQFGLARDLSHAAAFAVYFSTSGAALSTPHLYLSALATFPRPTNLHETWRAHFRGIPTFKNAVRGTGGSPLISIHVKGEAVAVAVAVSPDGFWAAAGLTDSTVRVWSLSTGEESKILTGHSDRVNSVAFSPDGKCIVSGSDDESVRVWDAISGEVLKVLMGHRDQVTSVAFSPGGTRIVSGSHDESVLVWDASSGEQLKCFGGHRSAVYSVAFSSDDTRIVSGSNDETVRVWDATSGDELTIFEGHSGLVTSVAFSSDSTRIVSGSADKSVRVWAMSSGEVQHILEGHSSRVTSVGFSPDGTCVVSGSGDESVRVWDLYSGQEVQIFEGHSHWVQAVAFLPNGTRIISASADQSVLVWDVTRDEEPKILEGHRSAVMSAAFSADGTRIISGSKDQSVRMWDATSGAELHIFKGHTDWVNSVAFSPDGTCIVSGSADTSVRVWDAISGEVVKVLKGHWGQVDSVAFSPDGTRIVSGSRDRTVRVWDASSGEQLKSFGGHSGEVYSVAFSSDDTRVVSGSRDKTVRVWDASGGEELKVLQGHSSDVQAVAFSPDATRVVSGSDDRTVRMWDASSGEELKVLEGHLDTIFSVDFSPDSMRIVSGSRDESVRVWNAYSGEQLTIIKAHSNWVRAVAFSPDGTCIVSCSDDRSVRVWPATTDHIVNEYIREKNLEGNLTGWLLSPTIPSAYLMFVPLSEDLPDDSNILTIPRSNISSVDFSSAKLGPEWAQCYTPVNEEQSC